MERVYKIVKEKYPSENFIRFIPKYIYKNMLEGVDSPKWNIVPYDSDFLILNEYVKSEEEAQTIIDNFEKEYQEIENKNKSSIYYTPKVSQTK